MPTPTPTPTPMPMPMSAAVLGLGLDLGTRCSVSASASRLGLAALPLGRWVTPLVARAVSGHDPPPQRQAPPYTQFPHHGLDAYAVGLEALTKADALAKKLPRGYGPLSDQLRRASQSAFLQLSEGAARTSADRAQRLRGARAEACEACVEALERLGLATAADAGELLSLLGRLAAMLTKLAAR